MLPALKQIRPLLGRIVIQKYIAPKTKKTPTGTIYYTNTKDSGIGKVVAVGSGKVSDQGHSVPISINVGDYVLLPEFGATKVPKTEGYDEELLIYQSDDIIAIVEADFETKI